MKYNHFLALFCAAALSVLCAGCADGESSGGFQTTVPAVTTVPTVTSVSGTAHSAGSLQSTEAHPHDLEQAVAAADDEAFLSITDGAFYLTYDGLAEAPDNPCMSYDAGVAKITGDGKYTVSVRSDTKGVRLEATKDPNGDLHVSGCQFAAVVIRKGAVRYPNMCIVIDEIRKDGKPVDLTAMNYTFSGDGSEIRTNIYNQWVNTFPADARSAEGAVSGEFGEYSAQIIDPEKLGEWKQIEVDFTVTGCSPVTTAATVTTLSETTAETSSVSSSATSSVSTVTTVTKAVTTSSSSAKRAAVTTTRGPVG